MKTNVSGDQYRIGPNPAEIIVCLVAVVGCCWLLTNGVQPRLPRNRVSIFHVILLLGILLAVCRSYVFDTNGVTIVLFGIPVKKLTWGQIGQVILIRKRVPSFRGNSEGTLLIVPHSCAPFRIGEEEAYRYSSKHPFAVLAISVPPEKTEEYASGIGKYCHCLIDISEHP